MAFLPVPKKPIADNPLLAIEMWPIDKPIDYPRNARKWTAKAVEKIAASIREFGWRQPVVVDSAGVIVIGHLRRQGGKAAGETQCPVHVARDLSPAKIKALRLADNRLHEEAAWDLELLGPEFLELKALDFDLSATGFDTREIDQFTLAPNPAEDDVPPVPEAPVTQPGDLWEMGDHRLLCGDSTKAEDVARLLGERKPLLMVTDPPYGVDYDPDWRNDAAQAGASSMGAPGGRAIGLVTNDNRDDWLEAWELFRGNVAYVWHSALHCVNVARSLEASRFILRAQIIWAKSHLAISRGHYHWQHKPCWYGVRKGQTANWCGDRAQSTCWSIPKPQASETGHSTQKPVELMRRAILNHTVAGDSVYDPFLGSGTTLIAAELTGRICYGLEIALEYCDVIVARWQNLTGKQATLGDGDHKGATFEHVKAGRLQAARDAIVEEAHAG